MIRALKRESKVGDQEWWKRGQYFSLWDNVWVKTWMKWAREALHYPGKSIPSSSAAGAAWNAGCPTGRLPGWGRARGRVAGNEKHSVTREWSMYYPESHGREFEFYCRYVGKSLVVPRSIFSKDHYRAELNKRNTVVCHWTMGYVLRYVSLGDFIVAQAS